MTTAAVTAPFQAFELGATITIGGRAFTVTAIGDLSKSQAHCLRGPRGAEYWLLPYISQAAGGYTNLFYITPITGSGQRLRAKTGIYLHAYIFGDLLTDNTNHR
jgi:hypothetical protein